MNTQKIIKKVISKLNDSEKEYTEIEFVCVNPRFPKSTKKDNADKLYAELKKIKD